jgi:hypothetical protein
MQKVRRGCLAVILTVSVFLTLGGPLGFAAEKEKPAATIQFESGSVDVGIGFSWGSGTLTYQGKTYQLKVEGMSVGKVGVSKATATGTVYHLKKLEDINGNYVGVGAGATLGGGAGAVAMKNQNGVVIEVVTTTEGLSVAIGTAGVNIQLK